MASLKFCPQSLGSTIFSLKANLLGVFSFLSATVFPAVVTGLRAITLAIMSNPIGLLIAGLVTGAALVITNWQKVKGFFASFWKSIIKPIGEAFSWMGDTVSSVFGKVSENSPIKEFEKRKTVISLVDGEASNLLSKNSVFNNENPLSNNSVMKGISKNSWNNVEGFKIKHAIAEKKSIVDEKDLNLKEYVKSKYENKTFNQTQHNYFNISVQAAPNQDVRSLADEVIKRIREKSRDVLFDTVGSVDKILEKPYKSSNKIEKTHKNLSSFIKSGKNAPKIFNFTKKTLNQMTFFVDMLIVIPLHFSIPFWRNNYCTSLVFKTCNKGIAIVALVSYYSRVIDTFGQHLCLRNFISLTRSQSKFKWISKCIDKRMYFSCKATFAPP